MPRTASTPPQKNARKTTVKLGEEKKSAKGARMSTRLRVMLDDEIAMGPDQADLLEAIRDTGSISAAGRQIGISYRHAWLLADAMNRCLKTPLVQTSVGGVDGGGARISAVGEELLQRYRALEVSVAKITEKGFADIKPLLRQSPLPAASE